MPIKENEDGTVELTMETGEVFRGHPTEVMAQLEKQHVSDRRWTQNIKAENENLKAQRMAQQEAPPQPPPSAVTSEVALDDYIGNRLGAFLERTPAEKLPPGLQRFAQAVEKYETDLVLGEFNKWNSDFQSTPENVEAMYGVIRERFGKIPEKLDDITMTWANKVAQQRGLYKPLNSDEINMAANQAASQQQGRPVPPTPPQSGSPDSSQQNVNPWQQSTDELRKKVLEGGGLGKVLMDMPTGGTLGQ